MKRYKLKTPYEVKGSYDLGKLYPIGCLEVLQGQTTRLDTRVLLRAQPLMAPAYEKMNVRVVHVYVPYRILWTKWDEFIMGKKVIMPPHCSSTSSSGYDKSLLDYLGIPTIGRSGGILSVNDIFALPLMAYYKAWDDHFRDPDLQDPLIVPIIEDQISWQAPAGLPLMHVNWAKDRFTSALTAAQASPEVSVPVTGSIASKGPLMLGDVIESHPPSPLQRTGGSIGGSWGNIVADPARTSSASNLYYRGGLHLGNDAGISVSDLRAAMAIYNYKVNEARFSDDYEGYRRKYGLKPIDARLQKSEIIGGFGDVISISDVLGTGDQNLGEQGGNAVGYTRGKRAYKHYAPEHGVIMTLMYIRPKASYSQGLDRKFTRSLMTDFFQYEFKDLGYQPVFVREIDYPSAKYADGNPEVFGYEPRYNDYRNERSFVCGELKTGKPLSHWAAPRTWSTKPVLNSSFLECRPPTNIWASANTDKFIGYIQHNVSKLSFVPPYSDPKFKL